MAKKGEIKSLLTEKQKENCKKYTRCKGCPEFEKYYSNGMCCYAFFNEVGSVIQMAENKCGDCFWLTKLDTPIATLTHYCKLHYTSEIRSQNEQACKDFTERNSNGRR